jgi:hypothetical protein
VEELGARVLPSATTVLPSAPDAPPAQHPPVHILSGQGEGTFSTGAILPGTGADYHLYGEGQFAGLGHVGIRGDVHAVGFLAHGHAAGTVTLTNDHGSVTLALTGPDQHGFSSLPEQFHYKVIGGTGAYAHLSKDGALTLVLTPGPAGAGPKMGSHGAFSLGLSLHEHPAEAPDGAFAGHFTPAPIAVDAGAFYSLTGFGTLAKQEGPVSLTGSLQAVGLIPRGNATGELALTGAKGSVTLDLKGPTQGMFAPLPQQLSFVVHSGTGVFSHLHTTGSVTVHLNSLNNTFTLVVLAA